MLFCSGKMTNVSSSNRLFLFSDTSVRQSANVKVDGDNLDDILPTFSFPAVLLLLHIRQALVYPEPFFLRGKVSIGPLYEQQATMLNNGWNNCEYFNGLVEANMIPTFAFHSFYPAGNGPGKWQFIREYYSGSIGSSRVY
jgi:hypothetical protein